MWKPGAGTGAGAWMGFGTRFTNNPHVWGSHERLFFFPCTAHFLPLSSWFLGPKCGLRMGKCVLGWARQSTREGGYPGVFPGLLSVPSAHQQEPGVRGWDESAKHNCSLSGTKEVGSRAALAWHLGTQERVGIEVVGCELQALGSGWSPCLPTHQGYCE